MFNKDKVILITGCEGFIGSNIAKKINEIYKEYKIIGCGSLNKKEKLNNINKIQLIDYWNKNELFKNLKTLKKNSLKAILHMRACSATNEWNGEYLIENNTRFSNKLFDYSIKTKTRMIHASSASVYGLKGQSNPNNPLDCIPINMYAFSKFISDKYLLSKYPKQNYITSLRFFNVYGLNENHKFGMSSPIHTFNQQAKYNNEIKLFKEFDEQKLFRRDFISVKDISNLILELIKNPNCFGVFDAGSSNPRSFKLVANLIKEWWEYRGKKIEIKEIKFPSELLGSYQTYTCADMEYITTKRLKWKSSKIETNIKIFLEESNK